ncbi:MAG: helix-turn-helix domain-containing protein [Egibacteraceae bacterium]
MSPLVGEKPQGLITDVEFRRPSVLPEALVGLPPTLTVKHAARLCGIGRNAAYEAVAAGELPGVRIGRRWVVPTVPLLRLLGVEVAEEVPLARGSRR